MTHVPETQLPVRKSRRAGAVIGFTMLWVVVWPCVMLLCAAIAGLIVNSVSTGKDDQVTTVSARFGVAVFFAVMVLFCLLFLAIMKKAASTELVIKVASHVLVTYMWSGIILGTVVLVNTADGSNASNAGIQTAATQNPVVPPLQHDPAIVAVLQQIGAKDIDVLDERYVDGYTNTAFPDRAGGYQSYVNSATGGFVYGTLTVKKGLDAEQEKRVIAHEYLHHVWYKLLDTKTKDNLTAQLIGMYGNDTFMHQRVQEYVAGGALYPTELFSYYCTESSDRYMTEFVRDQCNAYINRGVLQLLR